MRIVEREYLYGGVPGVDVYFTSCLASGGGDCKCMDKMGWVGYKTGVY